MKASLQTATGPEFSRRHCVVEKTSLYDMDCSGSQVLVACQDRNVRCVYQGAGLQ